MVPKTPFLFPFSLPPSHCHPEYLRGPFYHLAKFSQFCHNRQESVPSFCCHLTWKHCAVWLCFYLLCIFQVSGPACSHHFITFQISQVLSCDTTTPPLPPDCHLSGVVLFSSQTWTAHQEMLCAEDSFLPFPPFFPVVVVLTKDEPVHAPCPPGEFSAVTQATILSCGRTRASQTDQWKKL